MKKTLIILSIILILNSCGGFEFAYKTNKNDFLIINTTNINVGGDDADQVQYCSKLGRENVPAPALMVLDYIATHFDPNKIFLCV